MNIVSFIMTNDILYSFFFLIFYLLTDFFAKQELE